MRADQVKVGDKIDGFRNASEFDENGRWIYEFLRSGTVAKVERIEGKSVDGRPIVSVKITFEDGTWYQDAAHGICRRAK